MHATFDPDKEQRSGDVAPPTNYTMMAHCEQTSARKSVEVASTIDLTAIAPLDPRLTSRFDRSTYSRDAREDGRLLSSDTGHKVPFNSRTSRRDKAD
jgi:hypothetical protein